MPYTSNISDEEEQHKYYLGFPKALNTIQDKSTVDDKNLTVADNIMTVVDGITRRYGTIKRYDEAGASKVWSAGAFYKKSDGTRKFIRIADAKLQYLNGSSWTQVGSTTYTNARTSFIQVSNKMFIHNGTDNLSYYDGSSITTYTTLTTPTNLTITPTFKEMYAVTSITRTSDTATCTTTTAHGRITGDTVTISGAAESEYNKTTTITVTSPTIFTYSVSGTPSTPATGTILVTAAGTESYSYRVSAFNTTGESIACDRVSTTTGPKTLSSINYNKLDWTAVASATGYNIYGRTATGTQEVYLVTVYTNTYNDTGVDIPVTSKLVNEVNTTEGIKGKKAIYALSRQFVIGVTEGTTYYPTRLYYSGTVNYIDSFNAAEYGGGWVEIYNNDGGEIVDIRSYQSGILVFKTNGLFYFYFTSTGYPALKEITRAQGGTSSEGSQSVGNNIMFVGQMENQIGVWTVGTQENYGGDDIRTNNVTIFIQPSLTNVNRSYLSNIATFYYNDMFGFAYTRGANVENDTGFVFDTRFGGWVHWDGDPMKCTSYVIYDNGINAKLYGCSNSDGYMIELMYSTRNDNGTAFKSIIGTKFFNLNLFDVDKIFRNPSLWFKYISGESITAEIWFDGTKYAGSATLGSNSSGAGPGIDLAGVTLPGDSYATVTILSSTADIIKEFNILQLARTIGFYLIDSSLNGNWLFMGVHLMYTPLIGKPVADTEKVTLTT